MTNLGRHVVALSLALASVSALAGVPSAGAVTATPQWAPAATAAIHPGVQTETQGGQCTANFVFFDAASVYIGQAAHCAGTGGSTDTNGCEAESHPLGTQVTVGGASRPGILAYSSWLTMQARDETDDDVCQYNDFALVRLDPADAGKVNPTIPHWGGPVGVNTTGTTVLEQVYSYGNSSLRLGLTLLSPKKGVSQGTAGSGWTHLVHTVTPGIPGDSGSAFLDSGGRALGSLSTINVGLPDGVNNGVTDIARSLAYAQTYGGFTGLQLAMGTVAFSGNKLPLGLGL